MAIQLDHTIVPAKDKMASAEFFAELFGLSVKPDSGFFAKVQVNEHLTLAFCDEIDPMGTKGFDPGKAEIHHYAFHVSEVEFKAIFSRIKAKGILYGSGPHSQEDAKPNARGDGQMNT